MRARWLVDATGRKEVLARQLGAERHRVEPEWAVIARLAPREADEERWARVLSEPDGWWYSARLPDGSPIVSFQGAPEEVAAERIATHSGVAFSAPTVGARWVAVGDAASSMDPLSSQGMFFAFYSGIRAAEAIVAVERDSRCIDAAVHSYRDRVDSVFENHLQARRGLVAQELRYAATPYWRECRERTEQGLALMREARAAAIRGLVQGTGLRATPSSAT